MKRKEIIEIKALKIANLYNKQKVKIKTIVRKRAYCPKCNSNPEFINILYFYTNKPNENLFEIRISCSKCNLNLKISEVIK